MGIKAGFTKEDVKNAMVVQLKRRDLAIVSRYIFVGESFVRRARQKRTYKDRTGNLRSSICYIVYKDGIKRSAGAIPVQSAALIEDLRSKYMKGYVLIVVAGMNYAAAVESRGRDVLTGSSIDAKKELEDGFKNLKFAA